MPSRALVIAFAALTAFSQLSFADTPGPSPKPSPSGKPAPPPLVKPPKPAPECTPKPDHSNYGLNGKSWCPWGTGGHYWKPVGVGCKSDSECQHGQNNGGKGCIFPFTNGQDPVGRDADNLVQVGYGYCDYVDAVKRTGPSQCMCGISVPQPHLGGDFNPPAHDLEYCRGFFTSNGYTGAIVVAGCEVGSDDDVQCHFKCNNSNACDAGDDPNTVHKLFTDIASCPGYPKDDPPYN